VLINAGQANAATGDAGYQDCLESAAAVSDALGISPDEVLLLSTGVIGRRIKLDALKASVPKLASSLGTSAEDAHHAAVAITTTDLVSKSAALEVNEAFLWLPACWAVIAINACYTQPCYLRCPGGDQPLLCLATYAASTAPGVRNNVLRRRLPCLCMQGK
jgi:hypothetical protein